jgi:hypothetical protein
LCLESVHSQRRNKTSTCLANNHNYRRLLAYLLPHIAIMIRLAPFSIRACLRLVVAVAGLWAMAGSAWAEENTAFVSIKCGTLQISSKEFPAQKSISIDRGKVMALYYDKEEVVNSVKVSTTAGEVVLLTKSLDKSILLQTISLTPGEYVMEVGSAGQKIMSRLVVR